jgi:hypothetical protein
MRYPNQILNSNSLEPIDVFCAIRAAGSGARWTGFAQGDCRAVPWERQFVPLGAIGAAGIGPCYEDHGAASVMQASAVWGD